MGTFRKDGFLALPHCEEGQADFHLRDRGGGLGQKKWEDVVWAWAELQAVTYEWAQSWKPHEQPPELRQGWACRGWRVQL